MTWKQHDGSASHGMAGYLTWKLDRPARPALPSSYFWTWDHCTNWMLDDPGIQAWGACNPYLKQPATFIEDYRRLTDMAAGLGIPGILVYGFLRDVHGGIESAKRMSAYAASRGVAIYPGMGLTWYGGPYYEGDHKYNLDRFLQHCPEARMLDAHGKPFGAAGIGENGACPAHPAWQEWIHEGLQWMMREFEIGGVNLENGDFMTDHHPLTRAARADWPAADSEIFFFQGYTYRQALHALAAELPRKLVTYASYTGFAYSDTLVQNVNMGKRHPAMLDILPDGSVCQWTLTGMVHRPALPLTRFLDDGAPAEALESPGWPAGLKPPAGRRHVGFIHQGSYWDDAGRMALTVGSIKEACLRAYRSGLEGVVIHGEVSSRHIPSALNYLAYSHFIHWPEDSLLEFARKTLAPVLGSVQDAEDYVGILARWTSGEATEGDRQAAAPARRGYGHQARMMLRASDPPERYQRFLFWRWLSTVLADPQATVANPGGLEY